MNSRRALTVTATGAATIALFVGALAACGSDEDDAPATNIPFVSSMVPGATAPADEGQPNGAGSATTTGFSLNSTATSGP